MSERLLLDASVWLAVFDAKDERREDARKLLADGRFDFGALDLTLYEVSNVAVRKWHALEESHRMTRAIVRAAEEAMIRADADLLEEAAELASAHELTVYDAAYVAASQRTGWRLVSVDGDLTEPGFAVTPADVLGGKSPRRARS